MSIGSVDMMVWNVTRNVIHERMAVSPDNAWDVAGPTPPPKPDKKTRPKSRNSRSRVAVDDKLSDIQMPALVIQSLGDPVVRPSGSRWAFKRIGSEDKAYILFNFDRHGILLGKDSGKVYKAICNFIKDLS